jgi:F0F1-type ATP synthase delta subunit
MKNNKVKIYAKALAEVILAGKTSEKKITDNFLKLLEKTGQQKKAKEILLLAEDIILKKQGKKKVILESARKISESQKKLFKGFIKEGDKVEEKINPELIAGVKIIVNNEKQIDYSLNKKLQEIFK